MRDMVRKISIIAGASLLMLLPFSVLAAELPDVRGSAQHAARNLPGSDGEGSLAGTIGNIISGALGLLGVIFFILLIYAGALWMTAGGDTAKVDKAKKILTSAVVGLVIVMAAYAITSFIVTSIQA